MTIAQFGNPALHAFDNMAVVINEYGRTGMVVEHVEVDASLFRKEHQCWRKEITERDLEAAINALNL